MSMCLKSSSQLALEPALNLLCAHSMLTNAYTCELYLKPCLQPPHVRSPRWERNRGPYEREDLSELTEPSVTGATYLGVPPTGGFDTALITRYGQSQYHRQKAGGVSELLGVQQLARGPFTAEHAPFGIAPTRGRGRDEGFAIRFARRSGRSKSPPKSPQVSPR